MMFFGRRKRKGKNIEKGKEDSLMNYKYSFLFFFFKYFLSTFLDKNDDILFCAFGDFNFFFFPFFLCGCFYFFYSFLDFWVMIIFILQEKKFLIAIIGLICYIAYLVVYTIIIYLDINIYLNLISIKFFILLLLRSFIVMQMLWPIQRYYQISSETLISI